MAFIRVRKEHIKPDTWIKPDGLDLCMACWKQYMEVDDRDLGYSSLRLQGGEEDLALAASDTDPHVKQRLADLKVGAATDAMIDSLSRLHIWAIYKAYGMGQVWSFPNADLATTLAVAKVELEVKLRGNLVACLMF